MEKYFKVSDPAIDWKTFNKDIEFAAGGEAVYKPTGEIMEITRDFDDGHTETDLVKRRVEPPTPEIFSIETFETSPLEEAE